MRHDSSVLMINMYNILNIMFLIVKIIKLGAIPHAQKNINTIRRGLLQV